MFNISVWSSKKGDRVPFHVCVWRITAMRKLDLLTFTGTFLIQDKLSNVNFNNFLRKWKQNKEAKDEAGIPESVLTLDQLDNLDGLLVLVHLHGDSCQTKYFIAKPKFPPCTGSGRPGSRSVIICSDPDPSINNQQFLKNLGFYSFFTFIITFCPGFRIRIDLMRIRIRIRIQHFS